MPGKKHIFKHLHKGWRREVLGNVRHESDDAAAVVVKQARETGPARNDRTAQRLRKCTRFLAFPIFPNEMIKWMESNVVSRKARDDILKDDDTNETHTTVCFLRFPHERCNDPGVKGDQFGELVRLDGRPLGCDHLIKARFERSGHTVENGTQRRRGVGHGVTSGRTAHATKCITHRIFFF